MKLDGMPEEEVILDGKRFVLRHFQHKEVREFKRQARDVKSPDDAEQLGYSLVLRALVDPPVEKEEDLDLISETHLLRLGEKILNDFLLLHLQSNVTSPAPS